MCACTHTHCLTHTVSHTVTLSHAHTMTRSQTLTHILILTHTHTHTDTHARTQLTLTHTHTHTHTQTKPCTPSEYKTSEHCSMHFVLLHSLLLLTSYTLPDSKEAVRVLATGFQHFVSQQIKWPHCVVIGYCPIQSFVLCTGI